MRVLVFVISHLTRALMGLSISHHLKWGGGVKTPFPPSIPAPRRRSEKRKEVVESRQKSLRKYLSKMFAKFNIEIIRGHERPKFVKCHIYQESKKL